MATKKVMKVNELESFTKKLDTNPEIWFEIWDDGRGYSRQTACIDAQYEQTMDGKHRLILKEHKNK